MKKMQEDDRPTFKPILNEKTQQLMHSRTAQFNRSPRLDISVNYSYRDSSWMNHGNRNGTPTHGRSLTPTYGRSLTPTHGRSVTPTYSRNNQDTHCQSPNTQRSSNTHVSPRFNEIKYAPSMDYLLRRLK